MMTATKPTTPAAAKPALSPHDVQVPYLASLLGLTVRCRLLDGRCVSGKLVRFDTYCLELNGSTSMLLYKQALAYISPEAASEASK